MLKDEVKSEFWREPFEPMWIHLRNGKVVKLPFREMAHILSSGLLVFIGMKKGTRRAKSYTTYVFEDILRIERRPTAHRRRKAS